jgi:ribonuclease HI
MTFKGQSVWVRTDDEGRPVLDPEGRAEMKYREHDTRTYRPSPSDLSSEAAVSGRSVGASSVVARAPRPREAPTRSVAQPSPRDTIHVWTDGACSGNPGPMGIGIVVVAGDGRKELGEFLGKGTNNVAELTAIRRGLELAVAFAPSKDVPIRVYSDSSYAIGLLVQGWKAKANQALVAELREYLRGFRNLRFVKVEGHAGVPENERCDLLARQAIARHRGL